MLIGQNLMLAFLQLFYRGFLATMGANRSGNEACVTSTVQLQSREALERHGFTMKFTKMQGCGNDYVYIDGAKEPIPREKKPELVRLLSDRHFGVGSDGVIFINSGDAMDLPGESMESVDLSGETPDFEMEMYNADGTRAEMCGNGIRCVGKYVYDFGLTEKTTVKVISAGKVKTLELAVADGKVQKVRVNMGAPELLAERVPVVSEKEQAVSEPIIVEEKEYHMTCVSMGNPHAVVFMEEAPWLGELSQLDIEKIGPFFENHKRFPNRTNTEFVKVLDDHTVEMRVWERGTGETLACGTGACAVAVACVLNGKTTDHVTVKLLGGDLEIRWDREKNLVYMTGPAAVSFTGEIDEAYFASL